MGAQSPLLTGESAMAFLGLSLAAQTCVGHERPLAEGTEQSGPTAGQRGFAATFRHS